MADERLVSPGAFEPVGEYGAPSDGSVIPNGGKGRTASPHVQGWEANRMFVGIDVSRIRLDVHVRPNGDAFAVDRDVTASNSG